MRLKESLPPFDSEVPANGYRWWYTDGVSDDGHFGIVIIGFVGSVFSPYYFRARQRGSADPENYCAINVALYSPRGKNWAMTERGRGALTRSPDRLGVAGNEIACADNGHLVIRVDDRTVPWGRRLQGTVRVTPGATSDRVWLLDEQGRHRWQPIAPSARIAVDFSRPACSWEGEAYLDSNWGDSPLETAFSHWDWSRCRSGEATHIRYRANERSGNIRSIALRHDPVDGLVQDEAELPFALERTGWRIDRNVQSRATVRVARTLEDTPFYARSLLRMGAGEGTGTAVHESLSLQRFRKTWVRALLPFRMPRLG